MSVLLLPEAILFAAALAILLAETFSSAKGGKLPFILALAGPGLALISALTLLRSSSAPLYSRTLIIDSVALFFKSVLIFSVMAIVVLGKISKEIKPANKSEFYALVVLAALGSCIIASAAHFLTLFVAYEIVTFIGFILTAFCRESKLSSEASMKILLFSSVTSLLFVFGIVFLYGLTGSFNMFDIRSIFEQGPLPPQLLWASFGMLFVGIAARLSLFPFHLLGPDSIEGAPAPVAAYLSIIPTMAGIVLALRICFHVFSGRVAGSLQWHSVPGLDWPAVVAVVAAISMTVANLAALHQQNLKRLFGYAAIAQMSYLLLGFVVINQMGLSSVLFGAFIYVLACLGAFLVIMLAMDRSGQEGANVLRGLAWKRPYEAVALCVFILSLAALPPFAGFAGRFYLVSAVIKERIFWLGALTTINTVIALASYLGLMRLVFEREGHLREEHSREATAARSGLALNWIAVTVLLLPTVALGIYWDPLLRYISNSLNNILW